MGESDVGSTRWIAEVSRRQLDGVERAPLVPFAHMLAVAPAVELDEPAYVFIEWTPGQVERPTPGSAVWRAAIYQFLNATDPHEPQELAVRAAIANNLVQFPSLDAWFRWRDSERRPKRESPRRPPAHLGWSRLRWLW